MGLNNLEKIDLITVIVLMLVSFKLSDGAVYSVGGSAGWTIIGNVDYKNWAVTNTFHLGDTIVFKYNPQFHNVVRVTHAEYRSCNVSSPISTHTTGNDSITIDTKGHHFFVCGKQGHCQAGQKVDINVLRGPSVVSSPLGSPPSPILTVAEPAPSPPSPVLTVAEPAPSLSGAPSVAFEKLGLIMICMQILHVFGLA